VAVILAGQKRSAVGEEWRRHLLGEPDHGLTQREQIRAARGFVWAAARYRLQDATDQAWRPVEAVLASRELSNLVVMVTTLGVAVIFIHGGGLFGVVSNLVNVAVVWSVVYALIRICRSWRDVKPPSASRAAGRSSPTDTLAMPSPVLPNSCTKPAPTLRQGRGPAQREAETEGR
jgi:hypothetical protein